MTIYIRLKKFRELRGLTQQELANRVGVSLNTIQRWEYGEIRSTTFETLESICNALECVPGDLFALGKNEVEEAICHQHASAIPKVSEAIALLESLAPSSEQSWTAEYKARLYHGIREAVRLLLVN